MDHRDQVIDNRLMVKAQTWHNSWNFLNYAVFSDENEFIIPEIK